MVQPSTNGQSKGDASSGGLARSGARKCPLPPSTSRRRPLGRRPRRPGATAPAAVSLAVPVGTCRVTGTGPRPGKSDPGPTSTQSWSSVRLPVRGDSLQGRLRNRRSKGSAARRGAHGVPPPRGHRPVQVRPLDRVLDAGRRGGLRVRHAEGRTDPGWCVSATGHLGGARSLARATAALAAESSTLLCLRTDDPLARDSGRSHGSGGATRPEDW